MPTILNDRLLKALSRKPHDRTPIWIMRQAGRYLPEYRALRQKAGSFLNLCKNPEFAAIATLQPIKRYPLDAAIIFSDILTIPDGMGRGLYFKEGEGPMFHKPIKSLADIRALPIPQPDCELRYVLDAIQLVKKELAFQIPLIGFCGSPWTIAAYMVEGSANKAFTQIKNLLKEHPLALHQLLDKLAEAITLHLNAQIAMGADVVMLFDTWGGLLSTEDYKMYSLHYMEKIINSIHKSTPVILFTKGGGEWVQLMAETGCQALGLDWTVHLGDIRKKLNDKVTLQGNLHPAMLKESPEKIREAVKRILEEYGRGNGHIFNLGHGITQDISPDHVEALVNAVHDLSQVYHKEEESIGRASI